MLASNEPLSATFVYNRNLSSLQNFKRASWWAAAGSIKLPVQYPMFPLGQPALIGASYPSKKPSVFSLFGLTNAASCVHASARGRAAWNTFSKLGHNSLSSHYYCYNALDLGALNRVVILKLFASDLLLPTVFFIVILFILCSIEYLENIQQLLTAIVKKVPLIAEKSKQCMKRLCSLFSMYQQNASHTP